MILIDLDFVPSQRKALKAYQASIETEPMNYWLWQKLCKVFISMNDPDGAIRACEQGIEKLANNPAPLMAVINLYAAKGDYDMAITKSMHLDRTQSTLLHLVLTEPKRHLHPSISPETESKSSITR